ncbi:hypothetical protein HAX54_030587, partial [Datura stramonium]|nr:hypothetical protein [Datura stramonium]
DCPSSQEKIKVIVIAPIINIDGEPSTQDENDQQEQLDISKFSHPDGEVIILGVPHH